MKTPMPEPVAARVWVGRMHDLDPEYLYSEKGDGEPLFTESQLRAAMRDAFNEGIEEAAKHITPPKAVERIDGKAYNIGMRLAEDVRKLKETP